MGASRASPWPCSGGSASFFAVGHCEAAPRVCFCPPSQSSLGMRVYTHLRTPLLF